MRHSHRLVSLAVLFALSSALAGCGGGMGSNFDPTDMLDWLDTKKKLPGQRKPVFPDGVPGLQPGVPKELYRGAPQEPEAAPQVVAPVEEPKPVKGRKAAAKSRAPTRLAPSDENVSREGEPAAVPAAPARAKPKIVRRRTTAPPPDPEPAAPTQPAPAPAPSPFPAPLPSDGFRR